VTYGSDRAFRDALEARINAAGRDRVGISRLRKRVVFERLLARLQTAAPGAWVLKGGFALELRLGDAARTTRDIDIDWTLHEEEAVELLIDAAALPLDDRFRFTVRPSRSSDDTERRGQRWAVTAVLAGREFERVAIDIDFTTEPVLAPDTILSSRLLEFAGIAPLLVPAIAIEQHIAEKLHAYTRIYAGDRPTSRVKDLVDVAVIAHTTSVDAKRLASAIDEIFTRRATHPIPSALPAPPRDWDSGWRQRAAGVPAEDDPVAGHATAAALVNPVLDGTVRTGRWHPEQQHW
jgi:hypothetical protein